jgi:hypothetical protein
MLGVGVPRVARAGGRGLRAGALMLAALTLAAAPAPPAAATQSARLRVAFAPERLGAPAAISLAVDIAGSGEALPSALTAIDFRYPSGFALSTSTLGLAACDPAALEASGPIACPANSRMGGGHAVVAFPLGPEMRTETAQIALFAGPSADGRLHMLIFALGEEPVYGQIVMSAVLLRGDLRFTVPLVPSLPASPDLAVVRLRVTVGGRLTYYERAAGRTIAFRPRGIALPRRCPRGGFRFAAMFSFLDGSRVGAQDLVRCPRRRR